MKKENKEMARQRRAEQRKKEEQQKKMAKYLLIGVPIVLVIAFVIFAVQYNKTHVTPATSESEAVSSTETGSSADSTSDAATDSSSDTADANTSDASGDSSAYSTDTSLVVADGDTVNIDYVGSIDGVEFDGGNTQGAGADLTIGSNYYIDDFEQQLIGHNVGETVDVYATFPEDYGNEELNGKEALFIVTINGIYE